MVDKKSKMFVTGPEVIKTVTGEKISKEDLGGAAVNMALAGNSHYTATTEEEALDWVHDLLGYLPPNNRQIASLDFSANKTRKLLVVSTWTRLSRTHLHNPMTLQRLLKH